MGANGTHISDPKYSPTSATLQPSSSSVPEVQQVTATQSLPHSRTDSVICSSDHLTRASRYIHAPSPSRRRPRERLHQDIRKSVHASSSSSSHSPSSPQVSTNMAVVTGGCTRLCFPVDPSPYQWHLGTDAPDAATLRPNGGGNEDISTRTDIEECRKRLSGVESSFCECSRSLATGSQLDSRMGFISSNCVRPEKANRLFLSEDDDASGRMLSSAELWETLIPIAEVNSAVGELLHQLRLTDDTAVWARTAGPFQASFPDWYFDLVPSKSLLSQPSIEVPSSSVDKAAELILCVFTWSQGGHVVSLVGSFNGWMASEKIPMVRSGHEFTTITELKRGVHYYKFIVDDQWKFAPNQPTHTDAQGNVNNILDITNYQCYNFTVLKEHEKARDESYVQFVPGANDYATDAPIIPILLSKSNCIAVEPLSRMRTPLHALANHVYHDSHSAQLFGAGGIRINLLSPPLVRGMSVNNIYCLYRFNTITYVTFNPLFPCHGDAIFDIQAAGQLRGILSSGKPPRVSAPNEYAGDAGTVPVAQNNQSQRRMSAPQLQQQQQFQPYGYRKIDSSR